MDYTLLGFLIALIVVSIRQINQYERGVKFTLGKFSGTMEPGWRLVLPVFQSYTKVDMRVRAVDVPDQEAITRDNISAKINAVIYYKVRSVDKAVLEVEHFSAAVSNLAQTTMRNVVGEVTLDELLSERATVSDRIRQIIDTATDPWGIEVQNVELKDISLPEEMKRVIARQAEAEREKRATITQAEGEAAAAENLRKAAEVLSTSPGALHLRTLSTLSDLSSDKSNTVVLTLPLEVLHGLTKKIE